MSKVWRECMRCKEVLVGVVWLAEFTYDPDGPHERKEWAVYLCEKCFNLVANEIDGQASEA